MNTTRAAIVTLLLVVCAQLSFAKDPDPRFEGIWKGVEIFQVSASLAQVGSAPIQKSAVIAIGDSGHTLAVVQGMYPGRYKVLTKWFSNRRGASTDNALAFAMFEPPHTALYRGQCELVLSPDGNTITENGIAFVPGVPRPVWVDVTGTFHRQSLNQSPVRSER